MAKIDRRLIPSILKERKNGATYQALASTVGCSVSGIRKVIQQNNFMLIEEILIATLSPQQRMGVAYQASLVHEIIEQYMVGYCEYASKLLELKSSSIEASGKLL